MDRHSPGVEEATPHEASRPPVTHRERPFLLRARHRLPLRVALGRRLERLVAKGRGNCVRGDPAVHRHARASVREAVSFV